MKYVYMIDYENNYEYDQCECYNQKDVMTQLKYLKQDNAKIINVKLVEDKDRYHEESISIRLMNRIIKFLGYKPFFIDKN